MENQFGIAAPEPVVKPPRRKSLSRRVRRGLALVRELVIAGFDPDAKPSQTIVKGWGRKRERELNSALEWIESREIQ